jgi:subtilase family serine protease
MTFQYFRTVICAALVGLLLAGTDYELKNIHSHEKKVLGKRIPRDSLVLKGPVPDKSATRELIFAVRQNNIRELEQLLLERSTPGSSNYQQWLSFEEVEDMTSNPESAAAVILWLQEEGIDISDFTLRQEYIMARAPLSKWEELLSTEFFEFADTTRSERKVVAANEYSIPAHLVPHLSAVFNTVQATPEIYTKYHRQDDEVLSSSSFATSSSSPSLRRNDLSLTSKGLTSSDGKVTVSFLNKFLQIESNAGSSLQQQSVFETSEEYYSPNDLAAFQDYYDLPDQAALHPYGYTTTNCVSNDCYEGNLDVQYMMGIAQDTATVYWYVPSDEANPFVLWVTDVANMTNPPLVNSISWGSNELVCMIILIVLRCAA